MSPNMKNPALLVLAAGASIANAHGYVSSWTIGGTEYAGFDEMWAVGQGTALTDTFIAWSESASDDGYIAPDAYGTADIICHKDATNGQLNTASVAAGGTVTATWNTWPSTHHGPIINYIAAADDPTTVDKTTLEWVKIDESGLISGSNPGVWASDDLITNGLSYDITIPATLKPGNYVLRHEIIALHSAYDSDGAQNYPMCVNLKVTGSGTELPAGTLGTALYTESDPSIIFDIYEAFTDYTVPGPALAFTGSDTASSDSSAAAATTASSSAVAAAATPVASSSSSSSSVVAAEPTSSSSVAPVAAAAAATTSDAAPVASPTAAATKSCNKRRHARAIKN